MRVEVTQEHIKNAERGDQCPLALSLSEAFNKRVVVDTDKLIVLHDETFTEYPLSQRCQNFVGKFDEGKFVKGFSFTVTP